MPNVWRQFAQLLPEAPLLLGTLLAEHADGTVTVQLLAGGLLRVTGSGTGGDRVFVRAGAVVGPAPALPSVDIEV